LGGHYHWPLAELQALLPEELRFWFNAMMALKEKAKG
jgi:hypothetical protein